MLEELSQPRPRSNFLKKPLFRLPLIAKRCAGDEVGTILLFGCKVKVDSYFAYFWGIIFLKFIEALK